MTLSKLAAGAAMAAIFAFGSGGAAAMQPAATGAGNSSPAAPSADASRRVCRSIRPTGSRLATRICRTQAQWDELREEARQHVENGQNEGSSRNFDYDGPGR